MKIAVVTHEGFNEIDLFLAKGNIATAGGCLSSQYLAAWIIHRKLGSEVMTEALKSLAPVSEEKNSLIERILSLMKFRSNSESPNPLLDISQRLFQE